MLVNAMEVSGIEGNYRSVCEVVMDVLREQRDSVMAMLEAFVHDPLINWGLLEKEQQASAAAVKAKKATSDKRLSQENGSQKLNQSAPTMTETLETVGEEDEEGGEDGDSVADDTTEAKSADYVHASTASGQAAGSMANPSQEIDSSAITNVNSSSQMNNKSVLTAEPIKKTRLRKVKRASQKLSAMGGIKTPTVHDAIAKGDEQLAMKLSTSGMAQSFSVRGRSIRASYSRSQGTDTSSSTLGSANIGSGIHTGNKNSSGILNQKAITVTERVRDKLTGKDFGNDVRLAAPT